MVHGTRKVHVRKHTVEAYYKTIDDDKRKKKKKRIIDDDKPAKYKKGFWSP